MGMQGMDGMTYLVARALMVERRPLVDVGVEVERSDWVGEAR